MIVLACDKGIGIASQEAKMETTNSPKTRARPVMAMRFRFRRVQNSRCLIKAGFGFFVFGFWQKPISKMQRLAHVT